MKLRLSWVEDFLNACDAQRAGSATGWWPGRAALAVDAGSRQAGGALWRSVSHHRCDALELPEQRSPPSVCSHAVQSFEPEPARAPRVVGADGAWRIH